MKIRHKPRAALRKLKASRARKRNSPSNAREVARRDARMLAKVRSGSLPYTSAVMSWLSRRLDKPATRILPADVKALLK